ncbi:MAG: glucose-6-phosphate isomerase, partial [Coprobacillus sp.]|nr:glucose-6-phosphate isomerase [Coprobacillus sp.]
MIKVDLSQAKLAESMDTYSEQVTSVHDMIHNKTGKGNDFLGWVDLPITYDKEEVKAIKEKVSELKNEIDVLLVCGIGGSYLGARAAIEAINGLFPTNDVEIIYVGNTFSSHYLSQVKEYVKNKEFAINVISKSGTTTETSIAFRIFKDLLETTKG